MHKIVTGVVAGTAGIALLLGGAGTFALWNDSASTPAGTVSSGTLTMSANPDGVWTDITNGRSDVIDITTARMVPGNTYRFHQTVDVTATGKDLTADLTYAPQSITGDAELIAASTQYLTLASADANLTPVGRTAWDVTPAAGTSVLDVSYTIGLSSDVTTGKAQSIDLSGLTFTLTQKPIES